MEFQFIEQKVPEHISTGDVIELFNSEDAGLNGNWTVVQIEDVTGDVTLVGMGSKSGCISTVCMFPPEED